MKMTREDGMLTREMIQQYLKEANEDFERNSYGSINSRDLKHLCDLAIKGLEGESSVSALVEALMRERDGWRLVARGKRCVDLDERVSASAQALANYKGAKP